MGVVGPKMPASQRRVGLGPPAESTKAGAGAPLKVHERCGNLAFKWKLNDGGGATDASAEGTPVASPVDHLRNGKPSTSAETGVLRGFRAMFLPEGYPDSVSSDYTAYQICDTLQALCSSVTGTLSTRAILKGVGVGEAEATALGGLAQWVLRDGIGMVGRITFATAISSDLDNDAKRWRLAADITNDAGLMLEIMSSHFPAAWFLVTVCIANLFKAVTCVAGGATRASLTQHFAIRQNMADVAAKDGSQETAVNLMGMFLGMLVAAYVPETFTATLITFAVFAGLHLVSNYLGVKALILDRLNEARLLIAIERVAAGGQVPTPAQMRKLEPVVIPVRKPVRVVLGASLRSAVASARSPTPSSSKIKSDLETRGFTVISDRDGAQHVMLAHGSEERPEVLLEAYVTALLAGVPSASAIGAASAKLRWDALKPQLQAAGWHIDRVLLRVRDYRIEFESS